MLGIRTDGRMQGALQMAVGHGKRLSGLTISLRFAPCVAIACTRIYPPTTFESCANNKQPQEQGLPFQGRQRARVYWDWVGAQRNESVFIGLHPTRRLMKRHAGWGLAGKAQEIKGSRGWAESG